ncbi:MAG: fatty acid desaturase, partial [Gammaproteobacteria bacterium]
MLTKSQKTLYNVVIYMIAITYLPLIIITAKAFDNLYFTNFQYCAFIFMVGIVSHKAMTSAHELLHRPNKFARLLSKLIYTLTFWLGFYMEHLYLHHSKKYFLMAEDVEWARYRETLYQFIIRSGKQGIRIIWLCEKERLTKNNQCIWSIDNKAIQAILFPLVAYLILLLFIKLSSLLLLLIGVIFGTLRFITSGYLGHYGLLRVNSNTHRSEIHSNHAWDRNDPFNKYFYLGATRHHLHHLYPSKHFYEIVRLPTSEVELPYSYEIMYIAALLPFVFFKIMDKKFNQLESIINKNRDSKRISDLSTLTIKIFWVRSKNLWVNSINILSYKLKELFTNRVVH